MGCTKIGALALLIFFTSVVLNLVSFILPMWTTSNAVNDSLVAKLSSASFAAGLWGFCTDVELLSSSAAGNASGTFNHCYLFRTPTRYNLTQVVPSLTTNFSHGSVCHDYSKARVLGRDAQLEYASALAYSAGMNDTTFDKFLSTSCGGVGHASLAFGSISIFSGVFAFIALVLGVTFRKTSSLIILLGRVMAVLAFFATLLTYILWAVQSRMLNDEDDVALAGAFQLSVSASVLYLVGMALVAAFRDQRKCLAHTPVCYTVRLLTAHWSFVLHEQSTILTWSGPSRSTCSRSRDRSTRGQTPRPLESVRCRILRRSGK